VSKKTKQTEQIEVEAPRIHYKHGERTLSVQLTDAELLEQARRMAEATEEAEAAEAEQKTAATHYKAKAEEARGKAKAARTLLRNGYDYRSVKVTMTLDFDKKIVTITRDDTGAVVEAREMTARELQIPLPGTDEPKEEPSDEEPAA
jgi:hypothetical protein